MLKQVLIKKKQKKLKKLEAAGAKVELNKLKIKLLVVKSAFCMQLSYTEKKNKENFGKLKKIYQYQT